MNLRQQTEGRMQAVLDHLTQELKNIRTGRANPGMVENVSVEVYGAPMRLKDVATISCPEPRQLLITPYDPQNSSVIGKAIDKANLGFRPIVEANCVRINIPQMDESVRKEMVKQIHKRLEEAKVSIRQERAKSNKTINKEKDDGNVGEDVVRKHEKEVQELTDKCCKKAEDLCQGKEQEVMTI